MTLKFQSPRRAAFAATMIAMSIPAAAQEAHVIKITYTKDMTLAPGEVTEYSTACTYGQAIGAGFVFEVPYPKNPAQFGPSNDVYLAHSYAIGRTSWSHVFRNTSGSPVEGRAVANLVCWTGSLEEKSY